MREIFIFVNYSLKIKLKSHNSDTIVLVCTLSNDSHVCLYASYMIPSLTSVTRYAVVLKPCDKTSGTAK